ncbi:MAG: primosomal protein N', partial [Planctomycetota bacterium]
AVTALARKGLVELREVRPSDAFLASAQEPLAIPERLTEHQEKALSEIRPCLRGGRFSVFLLHGITGSGKTEVYLRAAQETVALGRTVLYLVPEIALTPQTVHRLSSRFEDVAVFHSALSDGERNEAWRRVRSGRSSVALGTRSAVFAPVADLGLIVIDEEHESTFKQDTSPRYHARTVAIERARRTGAVVVLGSASPSLEAYAAARSGAYRMLTLPQRVEQRPLPPVQVVDLRYDKGHMRYGRNLSRELAHYVEEALSLGEQVLLFMNRRGFAATVHCPRCGHVFFCANCAVPLTYHRKGSCLLCHYCLARADLPRECPECLSPNLSFRGRGTERIEQEIAQQFPEARALRMDSDAASTRDFYRLAFEDFGKRRIDILVGTQVIAKGLDFPNVTVVGVILADVALSLPDFRASERAFQLLSQVAGRAGRGAKGGRVVIQTYDPESLPVQAARAHDYERFAERELADRELHGYPPSGRLVQAVASAVNESAAAKACGALAQALRGALANEPGVKVLGPAPAPFPRLAGRYRYHVLVKAPLELNVSELLAPVVTKFKAGAAAITVDVDPQSVL